MGQPTLEGTEVLGSHCFGIGSWNVQGLTDVKLQELMLQMRRNRLNILCIQETRIKDTKVYEENGYLIILSGEDCQNQSWQGVGFIVAPRCKHYVKSYKQVSGRVASIKMHIGAGTGTTGILCVYAPHNLRPLDERLNFYTQLDDVYRQCSASEQKYIVGDFNARLGTPLRDEEVIIGPRV